MGCSSSKTDAITAELAHKHATIREVRLSADGMAIALTGTGLGGLLTIVLAKLHSLERCKLACSCLQLWWAVEAARHDGRLRARRVIRLAHTTAVSTWVEELFKGQWHARGDSTWFRMWKSATFFDGRLYITGGITPKTMFTRLVGAGHTGYLRTAVAFDMRTCQWIDAPEAPNERSKHGAVAFGSQLWLIGGVLGNSGLPGFNGPAYRYLDTVDIFDPKTGKWSAGPPLREPASVVRCAVVEDKLLVYSSTEGGVRSLQLFDRMVGCWADGPKMPSEYCGPLIVLDGTLFGLFNGQVYEYSVIDNSWHEGSHPRLQQGKLQTAEGATPMGLKEEVFDLDYVETPSPLWLQAFNL